MLTALLLLPVVSILVWLYWYCLPVDKAHGGRWRLVDFLLLIVLVITAGLFTRFALHAEYENAGPIWPELVAAVGAYAIFAIGLATSLAFRRIARGGKQV
jgi:hypothetical protein